MYGDLLISKVGNRGRLMQVCSDVQITRKYYISDDVFNVPFGVSPL